MSAIVASQDIQMSCCGDTLGRTNLLVMMLVLELDASP